MNKDIGKGETKDMVNETEGAKPDSVDDLDIINPCGILLQGSSSTSGHNLSLDEKKIERSPVNTPAEKSSSKHTEHVVIDKNPSRTDERLLTELKTSFHVNIIEDDDEEEEEIPRGHQTLACRSTSMAIPSMQMVSQNSIASSPPVKRTFAAVTPATLTTSSLAVKDQGSFLGMDDPVHGESYTEEWLGSIQYSNHKPRIISTHAAVRNPPQLLAPVVPILPSSPRPSHHSEVHLAALALDPKHRNEAIQRIHAGEAGSSKMNAAIQKETETGISRLEGEIASSPTRNDASRKSPKTSSPRDGSKNNSPSRDSSSKYGASPTDTDAKKNRLFSRRYSSTKSCQTATDDSEIFWNEPGVIPDGSSAVINVCSKHLAKVGMYMLDLYEHDRLTDVIVKVGSCTFSAHAIMLSCYSPYFAKAIKEAKKKEMWDKRIEIEQNVTPAAFQILLDYMYKGDIDVGCDNVAEVLCAASELGMNAVCQVCDDKLQNMDASSALRVLETAHMDSIRAKVKEPMLKVICQGFQQVCESPEIQQLCADCLCDVLKHDELMVISEFDVAMAALHWLDMDTTERSMHLTRVIACVRLSQLSMDELFRLTDRAPYIMEDKALRTALLEANWHQASLHTHRPNPSPSMSQLHPRNAPLTPPPLSRVPDSQTSVSSTTSQRSEVRRRQEWLVNEARLLQEKVGQSDDNSPEEVRRRLIERFTTRRILEVQKSSSEEEVSQSAECESLDMAPSGKSSKSSVKVFEMKQGSMPRFNSLGTLSTSIAAEVQSITSKQPFKDTEPAAVVGSMGNATLQTGSLLSDVPAAASVSLAGKIEGSLERSSPMEGSCTMPVAIPSVSTAYVAKSPSVTNEESKKGAAGGQTGGTGGQYLLMLGGYKLQDDTSTPVRAIHCFSTKEKCWQTLTSSLPEPRAHHSIVYMDSFIYVIGGYNPMDVTYSTSHRPLDTVFRVSTMDETGWTEMTPLTTSRMYHHSVVLDGDIYTLGGQDHTSILDSMERYIPSVNMWQRRCPMLTARLGCAATLWRRSILVVGGIGGKYVAPLDTVEQYDPDDDSWTFLSPLRSARCYPGLRAVRDELFLVGGLQDVGKELVPTAEVERLVDVGEQAEQRWEKVADMLTPRYDMACVADGDHLLILGGVSAYSHALSTVERYDVVNRKWVPNQPGLPQALAGPRCFVANFDSTGEMQDYSH